MTDVTDVLYIAGSGRSGSTVLEQLLATRPGFMGVGEFFFVFRRGHELNELCSCGRPFDQCPFWQKVLAEASLGPEVTAKFFGEQKHFCRVRCLPQLRFRVLRTARFRRRLAEFHEAQARLFEATRTVGNARVVVDSSKFVMYGYLLASNPDLRIHAIHLIRDPRAVAFSWQRVKARPESRGINSQMLRLPAATSTRFWLADNALAGGLRRHLTHACLLRYEDYCRDISRVDDALAQVGLDDRTIAVEGGSDRSGAVMHSVSGNPVRFDSAAVRLVTDDEWTHALSRRDKVVTTALAAPALLRYGYVPRSRVGARAGR